MSLYFDLLNIEYVLKKRFSSYIVEITISTFLNYQRPKNPILWPNNDQSTNIIEQKNLK